MRIQDAKPQYVVIAPQGQYEPDDVQYFMAEDEAYKFFVNRSKDWSEVVIAKIMEVSQ